MKVLYSCNIGVLSLFISAMDTNIIVYIGEKMRESSIGHIIVLFLYFATSG